MLASLMTGRALTATELAQEAGVTPQTASTHLARLVDGGLLAAEKQGRWTSYTLQSAQEGHVDFALAVVCHNTRGQRGRYQREALL